MAAERIKRHEEAARAKPPREDVRLPRVFATKHAQVSARRVMFAGMEWNVKGLANFLHTSADMAYMWALRGRYGIGLPESAQK